MWILIPIVLIVFIIFSYTPKKRKHHSGNIESPMDGHTAISEREAIDYGASYQSKYLLTKNEWYEFRKLREYAEAKNLRVCPKVRLLDIVEPRKGNNYMSLLGKIQSKHVDFVITDLDARIKAIVELDDNSHKLSDRHERDLFVDQVLTSVGYKVIRTYSITEETLKEI